MKLLNSLGWGIALLVSGTLQADMLQGLKAYEEKQYAEAQHYFAELLPLGNELAAFNLGAMAYQGEGQPQDLARALAYFRFAAEQGYSKAQAVVQQLTPSASSEQLEQTERYLTELRQQRVIAADIADFIAEESAPEPLKRVPPVYPKEAAFKGVFGYTSMRYLIDEKGKVTSIATWDEYPAKVFSRVSQRALSRWKFPVGEPKLGHLSLDFAISDSPAIASDSSCSKVKSQIEEHNLWQHAINGSPQHQLVLGTFLELCRLQSRARFRLDHSAPLAATLPDLTIFNPQRPPQMSDKLFYGQALVRVDNNGTIQQEIELKAEGTKGESSLVGVQLSGASAGAMYQIVGFDLDNNNVIEVKPVHTINPGLSSRYWWREAARNGDKQAQRIMAGYDRQWEQYLITQQDAEIMAWAGARLVIEGQQEQGLALLDKAISAGYDLAKQMKQQFM